MIETHGIIYTVFARSTGLNLQNSWRVAGFHDIFEPSKIKIMWCYMNVSNPKDDAAKRRKESDDQYEDKRIRSYRKEWERDHSQVA